jgi:hypothetical protein
MSRRALVTYTPLLAAFGCAGKQAAVQQPAQIAGSSLDRLRKNIRKHLTDKQSRERALAKVDQLGKLMLDFDRIAFQWRARSHEVDAADESQLLTIADDINAQMREKLMDATRIVYSLREDIPQDVWPVVFGADSSKGGKS